MAKTIQLKTIGYIALEVTEKLTKSGKVRKCINVLSTKIYKRKGDATKLVNKIHKERTNKIILDHLEIIKHAINVQTLRDDVLKAKDNIQKARSKAFNWIKGLFTTSTNYFCLVCAKIKLFKYINSLNRSTRQFLNEFCLYSQSVGCSLIKFNLNNLGI